uniref:GrpE-like 2, mitochondrial n=1 Tax=Cyprinus carpio TaxID=7962 RepID=A0A8C1YRF8_CYPCA
ENTFCAQIKQKYTLIDNSSSLRHPIAAFWRASHTETTYAVLCQQHRMQIRCLHSDQSVNSVSMHIRMLQMRQVERYKRALADSDNVRRRTQKFVEDAKLFGIQSFCRDIVEVADLLEKVEEGDGAQQLTQYMAHIQGRLQDIFTKHGLEKMSPVGSTYDPYQHEIVCHTPAEGVEPGSIAVVKQDGYMLHGRTIRHALVGIAVKTQEQ